MREPFACARVARAITAITGIAKPDLIGQRRFKAINSARQLAMYVASTRFGYSMPEVGRYFNRNHSTVLHARNKIARRLAAGDAGLAEIIDRIELTAREDRSHAAAHSGLGLEQSTRQQIPGQGLPR